ncbi:hypothetical protein LTR10_004532 [Elasticomyces elasticus]|nr:hypothetical protein LTR10_004532 [Elasticomyces elasticus]KAK4976851.1 hypothetical protein LTR42_002896 [Elasticomyces elasticus]
MDEDTRPTKRRKLDFRKTLRVLVGANEEEFMVYEDIITERSPFFAAAAAARWKSTLTPDITLPEDKPGIFSDYLQCLYMGTVPKDNDHERDVFDLYILADKLGDLKSANTIMDSIIQWYGADDVIPKVSFANYVFGKTASGSKLRALLVDYWVLESTSESFHTERRKSADGTAANVQFTK